MPLVGDRLCALENAVAELQAIPDFDALRRAFAVAIANGTTANEGGIGFHEIARKAIAVEAHDLATECTRVWAELDEKERGDE